MKKIYQSDLKFFKLTFRQFLHFSVTTIAVYLCPIIIVMAPSAAFSSPQVFWASDPVKPGEAAYLAGDDFGDHPKIEIARLQDISEPPKTLDSASFPVWKPAEVTQGSKQSVKFVIPEESKEGVYIIRITGDDNSSVLHTLNAPTIYWAQGDLGSRASPGGWIRAFGRCLGHETGHSVLMMKSDEENTPRLIDSKSSGLWEAQFNLPPDITPGRYQLQIYNGSGDGSAWVQAGTLELKIPERWPDKIFNVRDFGASGNGAVNDTHGVLAAVKAAGDNNGGVVFFPRGRYLMTEPLIIPRCVTLRGERRDLVSIIWQDIDQPPPCLIQGSNHFAIEDLTFYASRHQHVLAGDISPTSAGEPGNIRIQRVTIRADEYMGRLKPEEVDQLFRNSLKASTGGFDTIRLGGVNLVLTDCDVYGSGRSIYLFKPKSAYVARNQFYNGRWGWYSLTGADGLIFEDNKITGADLMATGGGINALGDVGYSQNIFFARNRLSLMFGWNREAMTSDAGYGFYYGSVKNVSETGFSLSGAPVGKPDYHNCWKGAGVFILGGKGMGQFAQIDHLEGDIVHLDRPWKVLPNESSIITITMMQQNYLFVDNEFLDAGVAIFYYGTSIGHVAMGNKSLRTGGYCNSGRWYGHFQPSWFCQFLENEIIEGNVYRANDAPQSCEAFLATEGMQRPPNATPLALGTIHRRNHLHSNAHMQVTGINPSAPGVKDVIIENNIVEHADVGLKVDGGCIGVLQRGNIFNDVAHPIDMPRSAE